MTKEIKEIYSKNVKKEWKRLVKSPFHKLEFDTTLHYLKKYLPKKGLILDAGGGPGRYTIELARMGYDVVLFDITLKNLKFAKSKIKKSKVQNKIKGIVEGSITNLSRFKNNTFDAVVCLGSPLSHLKIKQRKKAILELIRVAKKNAPIFVSIMGKFGYLMRSVEKWPNEIKNNKRYTSIAFKGDDFYWGEKGYFHYFTLEELEKFFPNKIKTLEKIGLDGLGSISEKDINKLSKDPLAWKNWIKVHYRLCTHPTIVDISPHIMIVGRKK